MKKYQNVILTNFLLVAALTFAACSPPQSAKNSDGRGRYDTDTTRSMIRGIESLPEVAWTAQKQNTVYVGLKEVPADMKGIANAWALQFNREWDFGAHVWMLPASSGPSATPDVSKFFYNVTARHGNIER